MSVPLFFPNSTDAPQRYLPPLQSKILKHVCTTYDASYKTLMQETGKNRITVLHSLKSLVKGNYVKEQKIDPKRPKSKLAFVATLKGISFAWFHFELNINHIVLDDSEQIADYIEYVKEVFRSSQRRQMLDLLFSELQSRYKEFEDGKLGKKKDFIKDCFCKGLLELVRHKDYNTETLYSKTSIKWLNKIFSPIERREIKEFCTLIRDNLTVTIQHFPG